MCVCRWLHSSFFDGNSAMPLLRGACQALLTFLLALTLISPPSAVDCAFINFENCLDPGIQNSDPLQLQWIPLWVDAKFNRTSPAYNLNVTVYGNVSGQQVEGRYPPPDSDQWDNENITFGKIANIGSSGNYSTLLADFRVLTYDAYNAKSTQFCPALINGTCPLGPDFMGNDTNPYTLPAFSVAHDFGSPYSFSTLSGTLRVISGDRGAPYLACVNTNITPDLGSTITSILCWLPAVILILKGVATLAAAIWSPWGSSDIFRWSSNYGRDEDQLRLVTPGFGDCLQYIQFVTLTGALSLQYPGFYQPAVSQTSWSLLLFNESYVSHGNGTQSLVDGIYKYNGTYGMTAMSQLIGMSSVQDMWACMAIWLLVIAGIVVLLCQLGFAARWVYRTFTNTPEEDLQQKNLPFTLGNIIRLLFNYFILPIVALSLFQLVISGNSPASVVACAVVLLVTMICAGGWILRVIFTTKPRTYLFDDMPTVLLYGPLYNTYSDSAAPFALVPVFITFMRAVALGAVQPSGIGQIIVLAICEVILILTLNGFRPFQNQTSMNAYHTFFAIVRLITVLLSIAFVPTLNVSAAPRGWIAYAILLLHAAVLIFGFFLNSLQTLIEVIARSLGVAGDSQTGAIRGSILNMRMLRKRQNRPRSGDRGSMTSNAAILQDTDMRSAYAGTRSRSMSASSQQLLNQVGAASGTPSVHRMSGFENFSSAGDFAHTPGVETDNGQAGFTYGSNGKPGLAVNTASEQTYYRPPRPRRTTTTDPLTPGTKTRKTASGEFPYQDSPDSNGPGAGGAPHLRSSSYEGGGFLGPAGRDSPAPAYFRERADSNENLGPRPDYSVREMDQYYRGQALSDQPTRKLKTGPVDPNGPAASAQSWFQRLMFGVKGKKEKEQSKGFEVVRSSRMMPKELREQQGQEDLEMQNSPAMHQELYHDSPTSQQGAFQQVGAGAEREVSPIESEEDKHIPAARGFDFGLESANEAPRRQDSGSNAGVRPSIDPGSAAAAHHDHGATAGGFAGMRAEQSSVRSGVSRPSRDTRAETESDYDRQISDDDDDGAPAPYSLEQRPPSLGPIESFGGLEMPSRFNSRRSANLDNGNTQVGQEWLRAIDEIDWNHNNSGPAPARQPSYNSNNNPAVRVQPSVPRRSSRRTPSRDISPSDYPPQQRGQDNLFEGFDSGGPSYLGAQNSHDERPSSYASVNHHRAADSISRNSFGANAAMQGSSAEIFGGVTPPQGSFEDQR